MHSSVYCIVDVVCGWCVYVAIMCEMCVMKWLCYGSLSLPSRYYTHIHTRLQLSAPYTAHTRSTHIGEIGYTYIQPHMVQSIASRSPASTWPPNLDWCCYQMWSWYAEKYVIHDRKWTVIWYTQMAMYTQSWSHSASACTNSTCVTPKVYNFCAVIHSKCTEIYDVWLLSDTFLSNASRCDTAQITQTAFMTACGTSTQTTNTENVSNRKGIGTHAKSKVVTKWPVTVTLFWL